MVSEVSALKHQSRAPEISTFLLERGGKSLPSGEGLPLKKKAFRRGEERSPFGIERHSLGKARIRPAILVIPVKIYPVK